MNHRDTEVTVECLICERKFNFLVNSKDLEKFQNSEIVDIDSLQHIFPYLENDDIDFLTTKICANCL